MKRYRRLVAARPVGTSGSGDDARVAGPDSGIDKLSALATE